jgi:hypothetical protein
MQDRPTIDELLAAVENFLDAEIVPNVAGARGFHGRVAANAIRIVRRELEREDEQIAAEWAGLDAILGGARRPEERKELRKALRDRNEALCSLILNGDADEGELAAHVQDHVRNVVQDKLHVTNPQLLSRSEEAGHRR